MKILVTGYQGFIGKNLIPALSDHSLTFFEWGEPLPKIQKIQNLDWVIHLGAISSTTETDIEKIMKQNYDFSVWILNECLTWKVNLQYSSSASVYGQLKTFDEEGPVDPRSPYAWSKYLFDRYVNRQKKLREFNEIIVQGFRYFNVYGPHEDHKGDQASPYHKFEQQAKNTGTIKLFQNSDQYYRDFVPVQTVVDVHKKFFNINESNIWNVGTGKAKSFQEVGEEISQKYNATIEYIPMPESMKTQYQTYTKANIDKLRKHFDL